MNKYNFYTALGANPIMYIITDNYEDVEKVLAEHPNWTVVKSFYF